MRRAPGCTAFGVHESLHLRQQSMVGHCCCHTHAATAKIGLWPQKCFWHVLSGFWCRRSVAASRAIAEQTKLFKITVSFGSVTSLISLPCYMSHASIPAAVRAQRGLPDDLVRVSVGIEDPADLLAGRVCASRCCGAWRQYPLSDKQL